MEGKTIATRKKLGRPRKNPGENMPVQVRADIPLNLRKILAAIKHKGIMRAHVERTAGLFPNRIHGWECRSGKLSVAQAIAIADAIDVSLEYILRDDIPLQDVPPRSAPRESGGIDAIRKAEASEIVPAPAPGTSPFDAIRQVDARGEYWSGRDLQPMLGYSRWDKMLTVIERSRISCRNSGEDPDVHFASVTSVFPYEGENLSEGGRPAMDIRMTRFGCYLASMNGDPSKPEIALAQRYFTLMARKQELAGTHATQTEMVSVLAGSQLAESRLIEAIARLAAQQESLRRAVSELSGKIDLNFQSPPRNVGKLPGELNRHVAEFVAARCRVGPGETIGTKDFMNLWKDWTDELHLYPERLTPEEVGRALRKAAPGVRRSRPRDGVYRRSIYVGIGLARPD